MRPAALALLLTLAGPAAPVAPVQTWPIDPARSQAQFSVRKFWVAHERGTFPNLRGTLRRIDTRNGAALVKVDAEIDVADLRMDNARTREHALGQRFFDVARFAHIHFDSDPFPLDELVYGGRLRGMLSLHGERHPVSFSLAPSDCPRQPLLCVIHVQGTLSRRRFGMRAWPGVVGDKVHLGMRIVLRDGPPREQP